MTEKLDITVQVTKEAHEIGEALKNIAKAVKDAMADGWQAGTDIPAIVVNSLNPLMSAIDGYDKLPDEFKNETEAATKGVMIPLIDVPFMFIKKEEN